MHPNSAVRNSPDPTRIHPALRSFGDECGDAFVKVLAYVGVLAILAATAIYAGDTLYDAVRGRRGRAGAAARISCRPRARPRPSP